MKFLTAVYGESSVATRGGKAERRRRCSLQKCVQNHLVVEPHDIQLHFNISIKSDKIN